MSRVDPGMSWIAAVWVIVAACSMGKDPAKKAPPPPPPTGTLTGHVVFAMNGPGADDGRPRFTRTSPIECSVQAGPDLTRTRPDGSYTLRVPVGHVDVSFADCAKHCCYDPPATGSADVRAGSATTLDFTCECDAK